MKYWVEELQQKGPQGCVLAVAVNKIDMLDTKNEDSATNEREQIIEQIIEIVSVEEVKRYCNEKDIMYFETSAKTSVGVHHLFENLAQQVKENM